MKTGASEPAVALGSVPRRDVREGDQHAPLGRDDRDSRRVFARAEGEASAKKSKPDLGTKKLIRRLKFVARIGILRDNNSAVVTLIR